MKYRDIAKAFIFNHGARVEMQADDGVTYGDNRKPFAPGQLAKANAARVAVAEQLVRKWDVSKKDARTISRQEAAQRLAPVQVSSNSSDDDEGDDD